MLNRVPRFWIVAGYVVLFWLVLPAFILGSAWFLDRRLGLAMTPSIARVIIAGLLTAFAGYVLSRAIRDFRQFGAELPVSALMGTRFGIVSPSLIQQGSYTYWRHPIYVFYPLLFAGLGLAFGSGGLLLIMLPLLILGEVPYVIVEERALVRRFGKAYEDYRRRAPLILPRLGTVLRPLFNIICRWLFNWEIRHAERVPTAPPFFVVAAHRNYLDPFFVAYPVRFPVCFVTTFEMFRSPLLRYVFRRFLCIPKRRYLNDAGAGREIIARLRQGYVIGVFPEGERSWTGRTVDWKPEAVALFKRFPEIPVLPIKLDGDYRSWPRWANGIRRAKLTITVQEPFRVTPGMSSEDIERELRARIEPDDSGNESRESGRGREWKRQCTPVNATGMRIQNPKPKIQNAGIPNAEGLTKVIYRCPACGSFEGMRNAHHQGHQEEPDGFTTKAPRHQEPGTGIVHHQGHQGHQEEPDGITTTAPGHQRPGRMQNAERRTQNAERAAGPELGQQHREPVESVKSVDESGIGILTTKAPRHQGVDEDGVGRGRESAPAAYGRSMFSCRECGTAFVLTPDYAIRYWAAGQEVVESIPNIYERIRIRKSDVASAGETGEAVIASCRKAVLWREEGNRMRRLGMGQLRLTAQFLNFESEESDGFTTKTLRHQESGIGIVHHQGHHLDPAHLTLPIALRHVRSVTTESNRKLQIYDGSVRQLWQLTFDQESVLKWQDFILETIRHKCKFEPNWR